MTLIKKPFLICIFLLILCSCSDKKSIQTAENYELIDLPDGSIVYLNKNSHITFDGTFTPRVVKLDGEAFFDVVSAKESFLVKTNLGEIEVIGTEFNVNSSKDEIEVEVAGGEVQFKTKDKSENIKRGEQAIYNNAKKSFNKMKADLNFENWMRDMKIEFNKIGRDFSRESKNLQKGLNKFGKDLKKESKKLTKDIKNEIEQLK